MIGDHWHGEAGGRLTRSKISYHQFRKHICLSLVGPELGTGCCRLQRLWVRVLVTFHVAIVNLHIQSHRKILSKNRTVFRTVLKDSSKVRIATEEV